MPNLKLDRSLFNRQNREQAIEVLRMAAQLVGVQAELAREVRAVAELGRRAGGTLSFVVPLQ